MLKEQSQSTRLEENVRILSFRTTLSPIPDTSYDAINHSLNTTNSRIGSNLDPKLALNSNSKPDPKPPDYLLLLFHAPTSLHWWMLPCLTNVDLEGESLRLSCTILQWAQGLCCHDEKYNLGYKCKNNKMKVLVAMYENKDTDKELELNIELLCASEAANVQPTLKVYLLYVEGLINPKTMALIGTVKGINVGILIGSGVTHKLISNKLIEKKMGERVACPFPTTIGMTIGVGTNNCVQIKGGDGLDVAQRRQDAIINKNDTQTQNNATVTIANVFRATDRGEFVTLVSDGINDTPTSSRSGYGYANWHWDIFVIDPISSPISVERMSLVGEKETNFNTINPVSREIDIQ